MNRRRRRARALLWAWQALERFAYSSTTASMLANDEDGRETQDAIAEVAEALRRRGVRLSDLPPGARPRDKRLDRELTARSI